MNIPNHLPLAVDKKEQIITAAMKLLAEKGIQATPMSAIARAAGTGMGTIYNYFATKEELINAIYLYVKGSEIELILNSIDPNASLKAKFLGYYEAFVNFYLRYPESFDFIDQMHNSPVIQASTKEKGKAAFLPVIQLIQQGQDEGIIKNMDLEAMLHFLAGTITSYVRWILTIDRQDQKTALDQHVRMVWDAIKE